MQASSSELFHRASPEENPPRDVAPFLCVVLIRRTSGRRSTLVGIESQIRPHPHDEQTNQHLPQTDPG